jgi:hypothetical protein
MFFTIRSKKMKNTDRKTLIIIGLLIALAAMIAREVTAAPVETAPAYSRSEMVRIALEAWDAGVDIGEIDEDFGFNPFWEGIMEIYLSEEENRPAALPADMWVLPPAPEVFSALRLAAAMEERDA